MSIFAQPRLKQVTRILTFVLAIVSVVFLAQLVPHAHANGQDEAACRLCQVVHLGVAIGIVALALAAVLVCVGSVPAPAIAGYSRIFTAHSPSRAPPAFLLLIA